MAGASLTFDILARDHASRTLSKVGGEVDRTHSRFSKLGGALASTAKAGLLVAGGAGLAAVTATMKVGIGEVSDYERGLAQLQAGLKSTHGAAGISAQAMEDLASKIQDYSGQTDDSIVATEQLLLTFTNIRNQAGKNNDIFSQTTKIAADMAARMGGDASSSAIQLGKALNDPVKGITALTRVGVSFTEGQKKQITSLVDSGKTMAAQKIILAELNKEFGGSAKAVGDTLPGQIEKAKRKFEDFSQGVASAVLPLLFKLAGVIGKVLTPVFDGVHNAVLLFSSVLRGNEGPTEGFLGAVTRLATFVRDSMIPAFGQVVEMLKKNVIPTFATVAGFIAGNILPIIQGLAEFIYGTLVPVISRFLGKALDGLRAAFQSISEAVDAHREQLTTLGNVIMAVAGFIVRNLAPVLGFLLKKQFEILGHAIAAVITAIAFLVTAGQKAARFFTGPFLRAVGTTVTTSVTGFQFLANAFFEVVGAIVHGAATAFGWLPGVGDKMKAAAASFDAFKSSVDKTLGSIVDEAAQWGQDTGAGFANGLQSQVPKVTDAARQIAETTHQSLDNVLRFGSPSKLMHQLGKWTGEGFANGLKESQAAIQRAIDAVTSKLSSLRDAAKSMASSIADSLSGAFDLANSPNLSAKGITSFLTFGAKSVETFAKLLRRLVNQGWAPAIVQQVAALGVGPGTAAARNLLHASAAQRHHINRLEARIDAASAAAGKTVAQQQYGKQIARLEDKLVRLHHDLRDVKDAIRDGNREMRNAQHTARARTATA